MLRNLSPTVVRRWCILVISLLLVVAAVSRSKADSSATAKSLPGRSGPAALAPVQVTRSLHNDTSPPLRTIAPKPVTAGGLGDRDELRLLRPGIPAGRVEDRVVQRTFGPLAPPGVSTMPAPLANVEGVFNRGGFYPPDTNGDVGPHNFVQTVNVEFQVFDKSGTSLYGPAGNNTLFDGFGGACEFSNQGDPIALYDPLADRWLISQFAWLNFSTGPYYQCIAVSATPDPTGRYHRYQFEISRTDLNDYPHFGVWPDAYYAAFNLFDVPHQERFVGAGAAAFDRAQMLVGQPATMQLFIAPCLPSSTYCEAAFLPGDLDGATLPPAGAPDVFSDLFNQSSLHFYNFHVDWNNPAHSSFTGPTAVAVEPFNTLCTDLVTFFNRNCIDQPGTDIRLDALGDRLMHRAAYRNFGDHQSLVLNHSVDVGAVDRVHAAVRWYEVRQPLTHPTVYQQGTYAPDPANRWLGSVAQDHAGNMALGYSVTLTNTRDMTGTIHNTGVFPSLRYTGRLATDALGSLPQGEVSLIAGGGDQLGTANRWGDYAMMGVDPVDDCTFWFTSEYYPITSTVGWHTRIGAFKYASCSNVPPSATATTTSIPSPTSSATTTPCPAINFSDVHPSDYFYEPVQYLACRHVISGYADGTFRPYNPTTRAQMVKIVVLGLQVPAYSPPAGSHTFADVLPSNPFYTYIETAAHSNVVSGYVCGGAGEPCDAQNRPYFRPNTYVTRGQLSKIVVVAASITRGWALINPPGPGTFEDVLPTSAFYTFIETAYCHKIISGYTCGGAGEACDPQSRPYFRPNANATRGQIAKIVYLAITSTAACPVPGTATPAAATPTTTGTATATAVVTVTPHATATGTATASGTPPTATSTPIALCNTTTISGAITMTDTTQIGRLGRTYVATECDTAPTCPGAAGGSAPRHYDSYRFRNDTGTAECITVTLTTACDFSNGQPIFSAAYLGSFDPTNICANYLGDIGGQPPVQTHYQITVPAGATYVVVVNEINPDTGCPAYRVSVSCGTPLQ